MVGRTRVVSPLWPRERAAEMVSTAYSIQYGLIGYWTVRVLCTVRYFCRYFSQAAVSYFILYTHLTSVLYNLECTYYTRLSVIVHSIECDCTWVYTEKTTLECTLTWVYFAKNYTQFIQLSVQSAFLLQYAYCTVLNSRRTFTYA